MSIQGMSSAWPQFRAAVDGFYSEAGERLRNGESLDADSFERISLPLDAAWEWSITLRREAEEVLLSSTGQLYEDAARLLLVAAAVDAMLATDIAAVDPNPGIAELRSPDPLEEGATYQSVDEERRQMLEEADAEYLDMPEMAGAEVPRDKNAVIREVEGSIDELIELAEDPGRGMVRGLASVAVGGVVEFVALAAEADVSSGLEQAAHGMSSRVPKFVAEFVLKIRDLHLPGTDFIREVAEQVKEVFSDRLNVAGLLKKLAAADKATDLARGAIDRSTHPDPDALQRDLTELTRAYKKQTKWLAKTAKWLRRGGLPISHLLTPVIGPVGPPVIGGVFLLGAGYVGYSVTDRIDARNLGFAGPIDGVVVLVDRHFPCD